MAALIRFATPVKTLSDMIEDFMDMGHFALNDRDVSRKMWPPVDIIEDEEAYHLFADIPGLTKEELEISVEDGRLSISGEHKKHHGERREGYFRHLERNYGSFRRTFNLPDNVDAGAITANYRNGTLELEMKKRSETKPREIKINVS